MSETKLKAGDKVKCIRGEGNVLILGDEYTIGEVGEKQGMDQYVYLLETSGGWDYDRFKLVEVESKNPEFFIQCDTLAEKLSCYYWLENLIKDSSAKKIISSALKGEIHDSLGFVGVDTFDNFEISSWSGIGWNNGKRKVFKYGEWKDIESYYNTPPRPKFQNVVLKGIAPDYDVVIKEDWLEVGCQKLQYKDVEVLVEKLRGLERIK